MSGPALLMSRPSTGPVTTWSVTPATQLDPPPLHNITALTAFRSRAARRDQAHLRARFLNPDNFFFFLTFATVRTRPDKRPLPENGTFRAASVGFHNGVLPCSAGFSNITYTHDKHFRETVPLRLRCAAPPRRRQRTPLRSPRHVSLNCNPLLPSQTADPHT